jgi:glycosyltransferase involved in cell wall biosynthesis
MSIHSIAFITSQAFSLHNFRGPLIRALVHKGVKVFALAPDYNEASRAEVIALGAEPLDAPMSRAGMNPLKDARDLWRLRQQLVKLRVDASFTYFIKPVIYGTLAARLAGISRRFAMIEGAGYVFIDQDDASFLRRLLRFILMGLYRFALQSASLVFLLNLDDYALFVDGGMVAADKVVLLNGIGVDLDYFSPQPVNFEPICFMMAARLLRTKGVYDYIAAARLVKAQYPEIRFLLLGSVDVNPDSLAQSEIDGWVAEGLIESPGHVADVTYWLKQTSVFVLPSYYREGIPRSIMEAMAMQRPVITTDTVGCRDMVEDGVNGFKVPMRNPEALSKAMLAFVEHPQWIEQMGKASRMMAENKYDVNQVNAKILSDMKIG